MIHSLHSHELDVSIRLEHKIKNIEKKSCAKYKRNRTSNELIEFYFEASIC